VRVGVPVGVGESVGVGLGLGDRVGVGDGLPMVNVKSAQDCGASGSSGTWALGRSGAVGATACWRN